MRFNVRYRARARLPHGQGLWPAFWLRRVGGAGEAEVDVMEYFHAEEPGHTRSTLHLNGRRNLARTTTFFESPRADRDTEFHTWAVDIVPEGDDVRFMRGSPRSVTSQVMAIVDRFRRKPGIEVTAELVRELLRDQHPDLADRPLTLGARGWANQLWRLGDDLAVRLPWQTKAADALLLKEHAWLPVLAPLVPLPVPVPQRLGRPSPRYPHPWVVTTWVQGTPADRAPATRSGPAADALAAFLTALHRPAPAGAPAGRRRGGALTQVARGVARQFDAMTGLYTAVAETEQEPPPDPGTVRAIWDDAVAAPGWDGPPLWLHGDLHPANVLTADGNLCGVVDFGDLCAGDPAFDLAACWILLPDHEAIERFRAAYPLAADDATWRRGRGWAVWRAQGSLGIAAAGPPGGKPSWGPPALASLQRLTASSAR